MHSVVKEWMLVMSTVSIVLMGLELRRGRDCHWKAVQQLIEAMH